MAFNITDLLNNSSGEITEKKHKNISYKRLIPNEKNFYSIDDINELADDIQTNGLLQNLVVKPNGNYNENDEPMYSIIVGHRRWNAIKYLVEKNNLQNFEYIDCIIIEKNEDELLTELKLHTSNITQRKISPYEQMLAIKELKRIYTELKKKGIKITGKTRELISGSTDLKPTQVQKYMTISEKADDKILEKFKKGKISVDDAYNLIKEKKSKDVLNEFNIPKNQDDKILYEYKTFKRAIKKIEEANRMIKTYKNISDNDNINLEDITTQLSQISNDLIKYFNTINI